MYKLLVSAGVSGMIIAMGSCAPSQRTSSNKDEVQERVILSVLPQSTSSITPGIPVYDSAVLQYAKKGQPDLQIRFGEPRIVSMANKPKKWGDFQFPTLAKTPNGELMAKIHMSPDAVSSYGKTQYLYCISSNEGNTWKEAGTGKLDDVSLIYEGVLLPNGDRLRINTPPAINEKDLNLPEPLATRQHMKFYKHDDLPESRKGVWLGRLAKGDTVWREERASLNDPAALRYSWKGDVPVVWWGDMKIAKDGSLIAGIYPGYFLDESGKAVVNSAVLFYRSIDNGKSWSILSRIPYQEQAVKVSNFPGFTEPAFEILNDGRFICVMRTTDELNGPLFQAVSTDQGKTWTRPTAFTPAGVLPRMLALENGVTVLASGRPGVQIRFTTDGQTWTSPFEMLNYDLTDIVDWFSSCGYTWLMPAGADSFYIIYSDFLTMNKAGQIRKSIKFRKITISKTN